MRQPPLSVLVSGSAAQRRSRWLSITVLTLTALTLTCGVYVVVGARRLQTEAAVLFIVLTVSSMAGAVLEHRERRRRVARYDADVARVFDGLPLGLALIRSAGSTRGLIGYANAHFADMTRYPAAQLHGVDLVSLAHPDDRSEVGARLERALEGQPARSGDDVRLVRADGSVLWANLSYGLLHTTDGEPIAVAQITDNTVRKEAEAQLVRRAYHDPLTDLPNRYLMGEHLVRIMMRARRQETRVGVLFVDLDEFKEINDTLGHDTGDRLLIEVAHRLRDCLRGADLAARLGGDEFVVVCEDVATRDDLELIAERVRQAITFRCLIGDHPVSVRASVGAVLATPDEDVEQILARADSVMYAEKVRRKTQVRAVWSADRFPPQWAIGSGGPTGSAGAGGPAAARAGEVEVLPTADAGRGGPRGGAGPELESRPSMPGIDVGPGEGSADVRPGPAGPGPTGGSVRSARGRRRRREI